MHNNFLKSESESLSLWELRVKVFENRTGKLDRLVQVSFHVYFCKWKESTLFEKQMK